MKGGHIVYILLAILAVAFWNEKGSWLFAGYNTMDGEEKQKYNHKKLCRTMSCCVGAVDALLILSHNIGENEKLKNIFIILGIIVIMAAVVLANTVCRKK